MLEPVSLDLSSSLTVHDVQAVATLASVLFVSCVCLSSVLSQGGDLPKGPQCCRGVSNTKQHPCSPHVGEVSPTPLPRTGCTGSIPSSLLSYRHRLCNDTRLTLEVRWTVCL